MSTSQNGPPGPYAASWLRDLELGPAGVPRASVPDAETVSLEPLRAAAHGSAPGADRPGNASCAEESAAGVLAPEPLPTSFEVEKSETTEEPVWFPRSPRGLEEDDGAAGRHEPPCCHRHEDHERWCIAPADHPDGEHVYPEPRELPANLFDRGRARR